MIETPADYRSFIFFNCLGFKAKAIEKNKKSNFVQIFTYFILKVLFLQKKSI
jgi:hypothetical protein